MAHEVVETTIETYLKANWSHCPVFDVNVEENQLPTGSTAAYLQLQFPFSDARRWSVGTRLYREEGGFRLVLSVPRGTGSGLLRTWGPDLRALFIDKKIGDVNCRTPSPLLVDPRSDAGPFLIAYTSVAFDYNFHA